MCVCLSTQQTLSKRKEAALSTFQKGPAATIGFSYQFITDPRKGFRGDCRESGLQFSLFANRHVRDLVTSCLHSSVAAVFSLVSALFSAVLNSSSPPLSCPVSRTDLVCLPPVPPVGCGAWSVPSGGDEDGIETQVWTCEYSA